MSYSAELHSRFEQHKDEFLEFDRIESPRHPLMDVCAFLMLYDIAGVVGGSRDMVTYSRHDEITLGVVLEAAHQRLKWGTSHDEGKTAEDWIFLMGYLAGEAARAKKDGNLDKAKHHCISAAAAMANWHAQILGTSDEMRPGIMPPEQPSPDKLILDRDIQTHTFRSAGSRWVNSPDNGIRLHHLPTGIVVNHDSERSQHSNRHHAMLELRRQLMALGWRDASTIIKDASD